MFQYSVFTRFFIKQIGDDKCSKILFSKNKNFLSGIVVSFCGSHHSCVSIRQVDCIDTYRLPSVSILYRYGLYRPSPSKYHFWLLEIQSILFTFECYKLNSFLTKIIATYCLSLMIQVGTGKTRTFQFWPINLKGLLMVSAISLLT